MRLFSRLSAACATLFGRARLDGDLDAELRAYLDELTDRFVAAGMNRAAAVRAARVELGGAEQVKERVRDARVGNAFDVLLVDLRSAGRALRRSPALLAAVAVTLGLSIGATTAIFAAVHAVLLAPLGYRAADRLVFVWSDLTASGYPRAPLSGPELNDLRTRAPRLGAVGAIWATSASLTEDEAEQIRAGLVTTDFFSVLGVDAAIGRTFSARDEEYRAPPSILLSWPLWQRRFGGDPAVVGRSIRVNGRPTRVIGVMPKGFTLMLPADAAVPDLLDAWMPLGRGLIAFPRNQYFLRVVARLAPAASIGDAVQQVAALGNAIACEFPEYGASGRRLYAVPLQADSVRALRPSLLVLFGSAAVLMAVACVNVATLLVAKAASRRRETAVRIALGAPARRLVRQLALESILLAGLGAAAGLIAAPWMLALFVRAAPAALRRIEIAHINAPVVLFTIVASALWAIAFSLGPALELRHTRPDELREGRMPLSSGRHRLRAALVVVQVALSVGLLATAGLMVRALVQLTHLDPGFRTGGAISFRLSIPPVRYPTPEAVNAFSRALEEKLRALPGVTAVGAISHIPYDDLPNWSTPYSAGRAGLGQGHEADLRAVSPALLATIGAHIAEGRLFTESDDTNSRPVVIVDDDLARRAWPGRSAINQHLRVDFLRNGSFVQTDATVVGVVRHLRHRTLDEDGREQVYVPFRQVPRDPMAYIVRAAGPVERLPPMFRTAVRSLDSQVPVYDVRPLDDYVDAALATRRFTAAMAAICAAAAVALAAVGIYGVLAYAVARRRHELGVRLALGARSQDVIRMIVTEGMGLVAAGSAAGLAIALAAARLLRGQLVGIGSAGAGPYAVAVLAILAVTAAASLMPAWSATRSDPLDALRAE